MTSSDRLDEFAREITPPNETLLNFDFRLFQLKAMFELESSVRP